MDFKIKEIIAEYLPALLVFLIIIVFWEVILNVTAFPSFLLPPPSRIFASLIKNADSLVRNATVTITEIVIGFSLGTGLGILMGIGISYSRILLKIVYPLAVIIKVIPIVTIAPLLTVWLGYGMLSKIVVVIIISFFPLLVNTSIGLGATEPSLLKLLHSLSANEVDIFFKVRLPTALPYILGAMKISITVAVIGAVIGEFVGATEGLGHLALLAMAYIQTPLLFSVIIVLAAIGLIFFVLISVLEKILTRWQIEVT